ncbi:MAG: SpoIIIAH-like family protein [Clostridiales bacterium]|jgi:stage III sporulation protein AH|nr:SpoIIIAH-like family protein [Clostridiales bacterium]
MFVLKRNQIIITALIVMIAVAGYLNYIDGKAPKDGGIALNEQGEIDALVANSSNFTEIGDALTATDDNPAIATGSDSNDIASPSLESGTSDEDPGAAVFVSSTAQSSYFVEAKLDREQTRAKEKTLLTDLINNENLADEQKAQAAENIMDIQKRIEKETAAEAMIEAKGFSEVYVRIDDASVDVVVSKEALTDAEIAQIEDIVKRKTGMSEDQIHIVPKRS